MNRIRTHIGLLVVLLLLASCSSRKKTVTPTEVILTEALLEKVQEKEVQWQWFSAKLNIKPNEGSVSNLSGQIRMQRDSVIWVSVTAILGMEVVRAKLTPDSALIINKLENAFYTASLDELRTRFGTDITFSQLQDVLTGNCLWVLRTDTKTRDDDDGNYRLADTKGRNQLWVNKKSFKTEKACISDNYFQMIVEYDQYQSLGSSLIPAKIALVLKGMYNFAGEMEYASVSLNQATTFPFKVSETMNRVRL